MKLVVGLGNPGLEYEATRHNVGFLVVDRLARRWAPGAVARARFHGFTLDTTIGDEKVLLLKPATYMNRSGAAVAEAMAFYKLSPESDLIVIVDDVALPCGTIRLRAGGGTGGHNGLADIQQKLGMADYARLRIGIDAPGQIPQDKYVLGRFRDDQKPLIEDALEAAVDATLAWVSRGITAAMNEFNQKQASVNSADATTD